jgi:YidC/Oxa1 family membrane protein insertase
MYLLFRSATVGGAQNQLLSDGLFGVPLGAHWLSGTGLLSVHDLLFLAVFAVLAALCWLSARLAKRAAPAAAAPAAGAAAPRRAERVPAATGRAGQSRKGAAGQSGQGAAAQARKGVATQARKGTGQQARVAAPSRAGTRPDPAEALANSKAAGLLTRVLPYVTVVIAAFAPLAAALYLLTTVAWTLAERRLFLRHTFSPSNTGSPGSTGSPGNTSCPRPGPGNY